MTALTQAEQGQHQQTCQSSRGKPAHKASTLREDLQATTECWEHVPGEEHANCLSRVTSYRLSRL